MSKRVLLLGWDGYIGNALTQRLLKEGYHVLGIDDESKRSLVKNQMKSKSALRIYDTITKQSKFCDLGKFDCINADIAGENEKLDNIIANFKPHTIVNLAHNPSAPFSMISQDTANYVLYNNIISTNNLLWSMKRHVPNSHLIVIGTTGEYDHYSNIDIEEGYISFEHKGRQSNEMIYPRRPGSIYHTSKVASTYLIDYLARTWNLKCTDIMQSVVFGAYTDEIDDTKIYSPVHSDEAFGTVINRFIVQAKLGLPLTVYGEGKHQRGFLSLNDSVQALMIAIENEPEVGKSRVWNQLSEWHSINDIAKMVKKVAKEKFDEDVTIDNIPTPRNEHTGEHYYKYTCDILPSLGYKKSRTIEEEIEYVYNLLDKDKIKELEDVVQPKINFKNRK